MPTLYQASTGIIPPRALNEIIAHVRNRQTSQNNPQTRGRTDHPPLSS